MITTSNCRRQNNSTFRVVIALTLYDKKTASASVLIRFLTYDNLSQEGPEANWGGREKKSTAQDVHSGITTEEWVEAFFERPKYYYILQLLMASEVIYKYCCQNKAATIVVVETCEFVVPKTRSLTM